METVTTASPVHVASTAMRLTQALAQRQRTLLAVGPMSKNCVDAALEVSDEMRVPLILIASRRQIDCAELGGGYVNNWTTEAFAQYVRERDRRGNVLLARDHGGPWQNVREVDARLSLDDAMRSCKISYEADIAAGFDILHLDPSIDIHQATVSQDKLLQRLFDLYRFCMERAAAYNRELVFEVGTEEQSGEQADLVELESFLTHIHALCHENGYPLPSFVVVQTGTKVKEMRNVGVINSPHRLRGVIPPEVHITQLVELCEHHGVLIKEHNTDYLPDDVLAWHPSVGVHSANIAPEFGVVETRRLLRLFDELGLRDERDEFLRIAFDSRKWEKWMVPDTSASDFEKAVIAGHYVFSHSRVLALKEHAASRAHQHGFDLESDLRGHIKHALRRYALAFNVL